MIFLPSFTTTHLLSLPGCPANCGNLTIPFPFGMTSDCHFDDSFLIVCNTSFNPPKPFLQTQMVLNISLDGKIMVGNSMDSVIVQWSAGNDTCNVARSKSSGYGCQSQHSDCKDSSVGRGHNCHCLPGYQGNPYLPHGCRDIDECGESNPCQGDCINLPGSFKCFCPKGFLGDGRKDGTGCYLNHSPIFYFSSYIYFAIGIVILAPIIATIWIIRMDNERKQKVHREKVFDNNGGKLLKKKLAKHKNQLKIFTADEMKSTTNNYSNKVEYQCKPGIFYHGIDKDSEREVIIMKVPKLENAHIEQFIKQLIFLSWPQNNLVNVIGCCLETETPLVVYEHHECWRSTILADHLLRDDPAGSLTTLVKAVAEAARALAYLHFHNRKMVIVHGNVSSSNILLDNGNGAKLFYAVGSNLLHNAGELNRSEDVFGFGSILDEVVGVADRCRYDHMIVNDTRKEIGMLARRCSSSNAKERPNMKEVVAKLSQLI